MNIVIHSRNRNLYSTHRLVEAGKARGYTVRVIDHIRCFMEQLVKLTSKERATAIKGAPIIGSSACGVDLLRSARGPLIMEENSSPGLDGIEVATKKRRGRHDHQFY